MASDYVHAFVMTAIFAVGGGLIATGNYFATYAGTRVARIIMVWPFYALGGAFVCWAMLLMLDNLIGPMIAFLWEVALWILPA